MSTPQSTSGENTDVPDMAALNRSTRYVSGKQLCEAVLPLIQWAEKRDNVDKRRCRGNCHDESVPPKRNVKKKKE